MANLCLRLSAIKQKNFSSKRSTNVEHRLVINKKKVKTVEKTVKTYNNQIEYVKYAYINILANVRIKLKENAENKAKIDKKLKNRPTNNEDIPIKKKY